MSVDFRRQLAEKHYPEYISPDELDEYLAKGWYRMGQAMFTTQFLFADHKFLSALWLRLHLGGYRFPKRIQKIFDRNRRQFQVEVQPGILTEEKEAVYQRYRAKFKGQIAPTLYYSLFDGQEHNVFQTYEVVLRQKGNLVAFSYFDIGRTSLTSIIGIYDPAFASFSLGLQTMLEEIHFGIEQGFQYFYPGYVVPGNDRFDYKLRIGEVDYFDLRKGLWLPFKSLDPAGYPLTLMRSKLQQLSTMLEIRKVPHKIVNYPLFEARIVEFWPLNFIEFPVFILCELPLPEGRYWIVIFDFVQEIYSILQCTNFNVFPSVYNPGWLRGFDPATHFCQLIQEEEVLFKSSYPVEISNWLTHQMP